MRPTIELLVFASLLLSQAPVHAEDTTTPIALRADLAVYHRPVTTSSPEAQRYFDQGLVLYYGFNHDAAIASFARAAQLDTTCAMAWWGQAISAGPHINNPMMDEAAAERAWRATEHALALAGGASPVERELSRAVAARYAWPNPADRRSLDVRTRTRCARSGRRTPTTSTSARCSRTR